MFKLQAKLWILNTKLTFAGKNIKYRLLNKYDEWLVETTCPTENGINSSVRWNGCRARNAEKLKKFVNVRDLWPEPCRCYYWTN